MKKIKIIVLTITLILATNPMISKAQLHNGNNTVLWKVVHPSSKKISFLLGTNHFYGQEWIDSFPLIKNLISSAELFICENALSMDSANNVKIQKSVLNETRTSKEFFKNNFTLVDRYFVENTGSGLIKNLDSADRPKIVVLVQMFSYILDQISTDAALKVSSTTIPMDYYLLNYANEKNVKSTGLDNIDDITKIYTSDKLLNDICQSIINLVQIRTLKANEMDDSTAKFAQHLMGIMQKYNVGQYHYNFDSISIGNSVDTEKRNKTWMKNLPNYLKRNSCFVAVGALHLDSKSGILSKLRKLGFSISAVSL